MAEKQSIPGHGQSPHSPGHQPDYVSMKGVLLTAVGVTALVLVAVAAMWGFFDFLAPRMKVPAAADFRPLPPAETLSEPRLDPEQPTELRALRQREGEVLSSYGWIDEQQGIARIPIERAMAIVAAVSPSQENVDQKSGAPNSPMSDQGGAAPAGSAEIAPAADDEAGPAESPRGEYGEGAP